MYVSHPSNTSDKNGKTTVVQGKWMVDFDESDCIPMWSSITSEKCIGPGVRPYYADLAYVPPGLDKLSSCQATPAMIHGRETLPTRCELLLDRGRRGHDEQGHDWNETLIARGEWDIEDGCVPRWSEPKYHPTRMSIVWYTTLFLQSYCPSWTRENGSNARLRYPGDDTR
ncbi:hypothetical protein K435DRAFT_878023 [Dendrothele bispora CBS 962.96]|uniref:Uncharacterized protein n=1 Tax=Dendrothele bispora (strain CBS 962.96) TaxID=1314807 RepID=A0A4S8KPS6_DENBC|nr:hypothetical protein K435DRAFT_878023 [Dendrothele bispora CBS 962.96]